MNSKHEYRCLQSFIDSNERRNASLERRNRDLNFNLDIHSVEIMQLKDENQQLRDLKDKEFGEHEAKISHLKQEHEELLRKNQSLVEQIATSEVEFEERIARFQDRNQELENLNHVKDRSIKRKNLEIKDLSQKLGEAEVKATTLLQQFHEEQESRALMSDFYNNLQKTHKNLSKDHKDLVVQRRLFLAIEAKLKNENKKLKERNQELELSLMSMKTSSVDTKKCKAQLMELKAEIGVKEAVIQSKSKQVTELEEKCQKLQQRRFTYRPKFQQRPSITSQASMTSSVMSSFSDLSQKKLNFQSHALKLEKLLTKELQESRKKEQKINSLRQELASTKRSVQFLESRIKQLEVSQKQLQIHHSKDVQKLEKENKHLKSILINLKYLSEPSVET
jgi:chromosome segregation ATPase